mmetsp:Transcript_65271/g.123642  ORF Transcript_65271/g.123642 Transcript_65271/m.123642 type:complete len:637 (+) Transcript_65271:106-2016(+)
MPSNRNFTSYVIPDDGWEVPNAAELSKLANLARKAERAGGFNGVLPVRRVATGPEADAAQTSAGNSSPAADPSGAPVVFSGLAKDWVVRQRGRYELMRRVGAVRLKLRPCMSVVDPRFFSREFGEISVSDFFGERSPVVGRYMLFENDWHRVHRALRGGYEIPHQLSSVGERPVFLAGRRGTGLSFQRHSESWMAQAFGRKVWVLVPGTNPRPTNARAWWRILPLDGGGGRPRCGWCAKRAAPGRQRDKLEWMGGKQASSNDSAGGRAAAATLTSLPPNPSLPPDTRICLAHPGDVVFVPRGWWHASVNIDDLNLGIGWEGPCRGWDEAMKAVLTGDMETVDRWCNSGDPVSMGAMKLAAQAGDAAMLKVLLEKAGGLKVLREQGAGDVAVAAADTGQVEMLEMLRDVGANVALSKDSAFQSTALHCAAKCGHVRMFSWLLSAKADIEDADCYGKPIHYAAYHGHIEVLSVLMSAKASIEANASSADVAASEGKPDAPLAAAWGKAGVQEALQRCGDSPGDLNALEAVRPLLPGPGPPSAEAPPALQILQRRTPLHLAAAQGHSVATMTLLSAEADPNASDAWGLTPFQYADAAGHKKVALQVASAASAVADDSSIEESNDTESVRTEPDPESNPN